MKIVIASGKGGTGKTTVATSLALALSRHGIAVQFIDCDVEEPNASIFLKPDIKEKKPVLVMTPQIDNDLCTHCGACANFCAFNALVVLKDKVLKFPEMCHGCTGCVLVCSVQAITSEKREIGDIEIGDAGGIQFLHGHMNVGEAQATPVISALRKASNPTRTVILDAPPGNACPFVETVKAADICVLVTEPTPFGLYDLSLAVETCKTLNVPCVVVINRCDIGDDRVENYCKDNEIEIFMRIPHKEKIAKAYSIGTPLIEALPQLQADFFELYKKLKDKIKR